LYDTEQKTLKYNGCSQQLTLLKKEIEWLKESRQVCLAELSKLRRCYKTFADFKKAKVEKCRFPKFKRSMGASNPIKPT